MLLEKTLESPLDSKEIKPVSPKEISPEYSLEGVMLKLQYFGQLMRKADSLEKTLVPGKIEGSKEKGTTEDEMVGWHQNRWCLVLGPTVVLEKTLESPLDCEEIQQVSPKEISPEYSLED